jgi:hypothetical protein
MNCTTSSAESERFGLLPKPFIEESSRMRHSAPFLRVPIWLNYVLGRACLSPCFSVEKTCIQTKIFMPLMRLRGGKDAGQNAAGILTAVSATTTTKHIPAFGNPFRVSTDLRSELLTKN